MEISCAAPSPNAASASGVADRCICSKSAASCRSPGAAGDAGSLCTAIIQLIGPAPLVVAILLLAIIFRP
jgi:hypothetical protein